MTITLTIEAEGAFELQDTLARLANAVRDQQYVSPPRPEDMSTEVPGPAPAPVEQPKADEKPKRKRRTKAEIEADKAAEKQAESEAPAENGTQPVEKQAEPAPAAENETPPTIQDVRAAMQGLLDANAGKTMVDILTELGAVNEEGHTKASALDEAKYAEAIARMNAAAAEATAAGSSSLLGG